MGGLPLNLSDSTTCRQRKCLARHLMAESSWWADILTLSSPDAHLRYFVNHAVIPFFYYPDMDAATLERIVAATFYAFINAIASEVTQTSTKVHLFLDTNDHSGILRSINAAILPSLLLLINELDNGLANFE